jgi:hypothetical protein
MSVSVGQRRIRYYGFSERTTVKSTATMVIIKGQEC